MYICNFLRRELQSCAVLAPEHAWFVTSASQDAGPPSSLPRPLVAVHPLAWASSRLSARPWAARTGGWSAARRCGASSSQRPRQIVDGDGSVVCAVSFSTEHVL